MANKFLIDNLDAASIPLASSNRFIVEDNERSTKKLSAYDMYRDILSNHLDFEVKRDSGKGNNVLSIEYRDGNDKQLLHEVSLQDGILSSARFDPDTKALILHFNSTDPANADISVDLSDLSGTLLTEEQISAINSIVNDTYTIINFGNGDISAFNFGDFISHQTLIDAGLKSSDDAHTWLKLPISIKIGNGMADICEFAFENCSCLTNITFPSSLTAFELETLAGCIRLSNVILPSMLSNINDSLFKDCSSLVDIMLPDSMRWIETMAFKDCISLTSLILPSYIRQVDPDAFSGCSSLTRIIVEGKTQTEAENMLSDASVPAGCKIYTYIKDDVIDLLSALIIELCSMIMNS